MDRFVRLWVPLLLTSAIAISTAVTHGANVTYDGRSLIIDGEHKILFSGSIHYPRSTPELWPSLIARAKAGGIDVIQTYVFWNVHEPKEGQYDFSGRFDLVNFIKEVQAQGLYVCLRLGPFIQSEWNYGGFPIWLREVPGIVFRSDNEPFKFYMKKYAEMIVGMMKAEKLYASQGGPIILSQIENEYGTIEKAFHEKGSPYVRWAAKMAVGLQTGVPWLMCKQDDAPDPVINACNGLRCGETFAGPNKPNKPAIWTEDWTTLFEVVGEDPRPRSVEDIAFHVALFLAKKKGSYVNYYMYHGGTNFGRRGADYVLTSYYDKAPLDEYGLLRQPKWGHLKELHAAVKLCTKPLLAGGYNNFSLGHWQEAHVFYGNSDECAGFLVNYDPRRAASVNFMNSPYHLPPMSISILPDCKTVALNTAKINAQYGTRSMETNQKFDKFHQWEQHKEVIPSVDETSLKADRLLEQMGTTKDVSDYLWYTSRFNHDHSSSSSILKVNSLGHNLHAFVNGAYLGSAHGSHGNRSFILEKAIPLKSGTNDISLLSVLTGLPDGGGYLERRVLGLRRVRIRGEHEVNDLTDHSWGYQIGMAGENKQVYAANGSSKTKWRRYRRSAHQRLTWYKTSFDAPEGDDPVALNLGSMGKGEAWVNGQSIGRYWVSFLTPTGKSSQTWYNVPRSFLKSKDNLLVIFEEENGNPLGISIDTVSITKVCCVVSDLHPPPVISWRRHDESDSHPNRKPGRRPKVQLQCPSGKKISRILFSSFGTPSGDCQSYATGSCHFPNSRAIVEKACLGKKKCAIPVWNRYFGGDPCPGVSKSLLVDAECG